MRKLRYKVPVTDVVPTASDPLMQTVIDLNSKVETTPGGEEINANESGWDAGDISSAKHHRSLWDEE